MVGFAKPPPAVLTIDIAFDWDSNSKGGFDGFCLCGPSGFELALAGRPPANVRGLYPEDRLEFTIYDISDQAAGRTLSGVTIQLRSAHAHNTAEFPFEPSVMGPADPDGWYPIANVTVEERAGAGRSGVYGGDFPVWSVDPGELLVVNDGWYFFKVSLVATQGSERKTFGNDPELIVRPPT